MLTLTLVVLLAGASTKPQTRRVKDDQGCDKGLDANNGLDGEIVCTRAGILTYEGLYVHGKRVGLAKTWRDNGKLASVVHFEDGLRSGLSKEYRPDGSLEEACEFKNDKKDGLCKLYRPDGTVREEQRYVAGNQRGVWRRFHQNGNPLEKGALDDSGQRDGSHERFREEC